MHRPGTEDELKVAIAQDAMAHDVECTRSIQVFRRTIVGISEIERGAGWDRAHEQLCGKTGCRSHKNPWRPR